MTVTVSLSGRPFTRSATAAASSWSSSARLSSSSASSGRSASLMCHLPLPGLIRQLTGRFLRVTLIYKPIGIGLGILAGIVGRAIFGKIWGLIDDEEPPEA